VAEEVMDTAGQEVSPPEPEEPEPDSEEEEGGSE
jgi:hypothetical protein